MMSGGAFDYKEWHIDQIADQILQEIYSNGQPIPEARLDYWDKDHGREYYYKYPDNVIDYFKQAVYCLKKAYIYAKRIDYLLEADDGEDTFVKRLTNELADLENKSENGRYKVDTKTVIYDEEDGQFKDKYVIEENERKR